MLEHDLYHESLNSEMEELAKKNRKLKESLNTKDHIVGALEIENKDLRDRHQR
ncbi:unnamed protein product, partial [Dovyalis caffra]